MKHFMCLVKWIESETGLTLGTDLFADFAPQDAPREYSVILDNTGGETQGDLPDRADMRLNIISVAESSEDARINSESIYDTLHVREDKDTPVYSGEQYTIMFGMAESTPQKVDIDFRGLHSFSVTYIFMLREKE